MSGNIMTTKYNVATGTWDNSSTIPWSDTDGGAAGAAVPSAANDVACTALSGVTALTIASGAVCRSLVCNGFTGSVLGSAAMSIGDATAGASNIVLSLGGTWSYTGALTLISTSATQQTLYCNGKSFAGTGSNGSVTLNSASGGNFILGDAFTSTSFLAALKGTFATGNFNIDAAAFTSTGTATRVVTLGTSTLRLRNTFSLTGSGLTFSGASSTIVIDNKTGATTITFNGLGQTFGRVQFYSSTNPTATIAGANTYSTLSAYAGVTISLTHSVTQTLTGGARALYRVGQGNMTLNSTLAGTAATVANSTPMVLTGMRIQDIAFTGAAHIAVNCVDVSGNSGITFVKSINQSCAVVPAVTSAVLSAVS
jgi:hypothetical protein